MTLIFFETNIPYDFYYVAKVVCIGINITAEVGGNWFSNSFGSVAKIVVAEDNQNLSSDENGVLYNKDKTDLIKYPNHNTNTVFEVPDSVVYISDYAFDENCYLTYIIISDNVEIIDDCAFNDCTMLEKIDIGKNVWHLDEAFYGLKSIKEIVVDSDNKEYCSDSYGVLYNKDKTVLIQYPIANERMEFKIPDSVTTICGGAFEECYNLVNISISDNITTIGCGAFNWCGYYNDDSNWESGVLYLGNHIIATDGEVLKGDYIVKDGTIAIVDGSFSGCNGLVTLTIPASVADLGFYSFAGNSSLTDIYYGGSKEQWFSYSYLPSDNIKIHFANPEEPNGVCGENLRWTLTNDNTLVISGTGKMDYYEEFDYPWYIYNSIIKEVVLEDGVTSVGEYAFTQYNKIEKFSIGDSLEKIGFLTDSLIEISVSSNNNCFSSDSYGVLYNKDKSKLIRYPAGSAVTTFTIPDSVTVIGCHAFESAENLLDITMSPNINYIERGAFNYTSISEDESNWEDGMLYIENYLIGGNLVGDYCVKEGTKVIAEDAFYSDFDATSITIPESVISIGEDAFFFNSIEKIIVDEDNQHYSNGTYYELYNKDKTELIAYPAGNVQSEVIIPDGVEKIADGAFSWCDSINKVILPDSVTTIGTCAFSYSSLKDITLGDGVTIIGEHAFDCCGRLTSITIPDSVTTIGKAAFRFTSLTDVYFNGTEDEWNSISIGEYNEELLNATILFLDEEEHRHSYSSSITKEVTCQEAGIMTHSCSCGDSYTTTIEKLNHSYKHTTVPSTCEEKGYEYDECSVCHEQFNYKTLPIGSHSYTKITVPSTCKVQGMEYDLCSACGAIADSKVLPFAAHNLINHSKASTCKEQGYEYDICSACNTVFNRVELPLADHSWNSWKVTKEPSAEAEGEEQRRCSVCGDVETRAIEKLNVIKDESTGIEIVYGNEYDTGVEIEVEPVYDGNSYQIIETNYGNVNSKIFDISTIKDGEKVQPDGTVKVRIPVPTDFTSNTIFVCYVDSTKGTVENIPAVVKDGYIEFEAAHFSHYAIMQQYSRVNFVDISNISMNYKDSTVITPAINADGGVEYTVTYSSSDPDVVYVDENGEVYAAGKGDATITCTVTDEYGNVVTDTCDVEVTYNFGQWLIIILLFGWIWYI